MASRKERIAQNKRTMGKQYGASIKIGKKGKFYNRYNPKTGKWEKVMAAGGKSPSFTSKGARNATSGTVGSALTQGKAGPGSGNGVPAGKAQGRGGLTMDAAVQAARANRGERRPQIPGTNKAIVKNKQQEDQRNQGRNAAAIAGLTVGAAVAGASAAGLGAGTAARAAVAARAAKAVEQGGKAGGARVGGATRNTPRANKAASQAKIPEGATRTSPVGNPRLNGAGRTGPKTAAQAGVKKATPRKAPAKKAPAKKAAPAVKKATPTRGQSAAGSRYAAQAKATPRKRK